MQQQSMHVRLVYKVQLGGYDVPMQAYYALARCLFIFYFLLSSSVPCSPNDGRVDILSVRIWDRLSIQNNNDDDDDDDDDDATRTR